MTSRNPKVDVLVNALMKLEALLMADNEQNWIHGVRSVLSIVEEASNGDTLYRDLLIRKAYTMFNAMHSPGGFGDYFLWSESATERVCKNRELERVRNQISKTFDLLLTNSVCGQDTQP